MSKDQDIINIALSGTAIYKAVRNFLLHDEKLKSRVGEEVQRLIDNGTVNTLVENKVKQDLQSAYVHDILKKTAVDALTKEIKSQIDGLVNKAVERYLKGAVFVVPANKDS